MTLENNVASVFRSLVFQSTSIASQAEKRQRSFDKVVDDWKRKVADLQAEVEGARRESRASAAEVYKLRAQLEEAADAVEAVRRENKNLTGKLADRKFAIEKFYNVFTVLD